MNASLSRKLRGVYTGLLNTAVNLSRKMIAGYYPILLGYPVSPRPRYGHGKPPHRILYELIDRERDGYRKLLNSFLEWKEQLLRIPVEEPETTGEPCWSNRWLPGLDAVALYGMMARQAPGRYIEIGSGNSTKFTRRAVQDLELDTKIISIDPHPRAEIDAICDEVVREKLENIELNLFDGLEAGDILYVDGSHYCFQNSDATVVFLDILPRLQPGVIVQIHDIFLPYDYPERWKERFYNEQYLLASLLLANQRRYKILLPNAFIEGDNELSRILNPLWQAPEMSGVSHHGGSFWMKVDASIQ